MTGQPAYMKPSEIKELLGISNYQFRTLIDSGTLPAVRVGRDYRVPRSAVEAWIKSQCG